MGSGKKKKKTNKRRAPVTPAPKTDDPGSPATNLGKNSNTITGFTIDEAMVDHMEWIATFYGDDAAFNVIRVARSRQSRRAKRDSSAKRESVPFRLRERACSAPHNDDLRRVEYGIPGLWIYGARGQNQVFSPTLRSAPSLHPVCTSAHSKTTRSGRNTRRLHLHKCA